MERPNLTPDATTDADAAQQVAAIVAKWGEVDDALSPVIGRAGLVALYRRGLHLTRPAHPWLPRGDEAGPPSMDLGALKSALQRQGPTEAAAGGRALLETVCGLLRGLVGSALSDRLLRSVGGEPLDGLCTQDISP